jgi:hypothetical protein
MRMNPIPINRIVYLRDRVERRLERASPKVLEPPAPLPRPTNWINVHLTLAAAERQPTHLSSDQRAFVDDLVDRCPRYLNNRDLAMLAQIARRLGIS